MTAQRSKKTAILEHVETTGTRGATAAEVMAALGLERSTASAGLARLASEGKLERSALRRNGQTAYVRPASVLINDQPVGGISTAGFDLNPDGYAAAEAHATPTARESDAGYVIVKQVAEGDKWVLAHSRTYYELAEATRAAQASSALFRSNHAYGVARLDVVATIRNAQ